MYLFPINCGVDKNFDTFSRFVDCMTKGKDNAHIVQHLKVNSIKRKVKEEMEEEEGDNYIENV